MYIDGFNLYHAMVNRAPKHYRWLDLWTLAESLRRDGETLDGVKYFSAYATWLPGPYSRHRDYVAALEARGVTAIMGKFKIKDRECRRCGAQWHGHEEKESDVNIALHLLSDAIGNKVDRAILVTADSDLCPAVRMVRGLAPSVQVFVATPPGMFGSARDLDPRLEITRGRIGKCQLPNEVLDQEGRLVARRPASYAIPFTT